MRKVSAKVKMCFDAYKALNKDERNQLDLMLMEFRNDEPKNAPQDPQNIADAVSKFKSMTLRLKSSWYKNHKVVYNLTKKKLAWELSHKVNGFAQPTMCIKPDAAERDLKKIFELGILNWNEILWDTVVIDGDVWTLDIKFKDWLDVHIDGGFHRPDKWDEFMRLFVGKFDEN